MPARLAQGPAAHTRVGLLPSSASTPAQAIAGIPESDPESWPQFVLDWDEDGVPHLVDVDASIEWDGWRVTEFGQVKGGDL